MFVNRVIRRLSIFSKLGNILSQFAPRDDLNAKHTQPVSIFQNLDTLEKIPFSNNAAASILRDQVVQLSGTYEIFGNTYDCTKPGVYRFGNLKSIKYNS